MGNGVATKPIYRNIGGTIFILYSPSIDQCAGKKKVTVAKKGNTPQYFVFVHFPWSPYGSFK